MLKALRQKRLYVCDAAEELRKDRVFMLNAVKIHGLDLQYASADLRADFEVALEAVRQDGLAYLYAAPALKASEVVAHAALLSCGEFATHSERHFEMVLEILRQCDNVPAHRVPPELRESYDFMMGFVLINGMALQFGSEDLKDEKDIVLEAVLRDGRALQFASEPLRNDHDVVLAAVAQNGSALPFASRRLQKDADCIMVSWATGSGREEPEDTHIGAALDATDMGAALEEDGAKRLAPLFEDWVKRRTSADHRIQW
jgi:hypothetical protein